MLLLMLFTALPMMTAPAVPPPSAAGEVVVTAKPRTVLEAALAACLQRGCPPDEDAAAALALAEVQFVEGDYAKANRVVAASLDRTRKHRRTYPEPVADLFRARGRIAAHLGEYDDLKIAVINARETLQKALPGDHPSVLGAQLELGDMLFRVGDARAAEDQYREVIDRAGAAHRPALAAFARLRLAALQAGPDDPTPEPGAERRVAAILSPLISGSDPAMARFRLPAALFLARLAERRGDAQAINRVLQTIPKDARSRPILLSADPIRLVQPARAESGNPDDLAQTVDLRRQWVDIGFWIGEDGSVRDLEVLRAGNPRTDQWSAPVLTAIRSRRYAPLAGDAAAGAYRVERYTLTAGYQLVSDSRIRRREPELRIEMLDLTAG